MLFKKQTGFTLIELLVVVLIIGILAAIALPQYEVAVKKARLSRYFPLVATMAQAEEVYFMANGVYTGRSSDLDVVWPSGTLAGSATDDGYIKLSDGTILDLLDGDSARADSSTWFVEVRTDGIRYRQYLQQSAYPGRRWCGRFNDGYDEKVCKALGGKTAWNEGYILE